MSSDSDAPYPLQAGETVLDRYHVEKVIARGGHSVVYKGIDTRLSRPVCIKAFHKLIKQKSIWQTAYDHFVQEAFALSKLNHPNTLRIYDFGSVEKIDQQSFPVQVSEYMAGGTLSQLVRKDRPLPLQQVVDWMSKLAEALAEAHRLGIIHRDIKPQNILFTTHTSDKEPKLADFGIAKSTKQDNMENQAENTEIVVGFPLAMFSPSWASPEQLCGAKPTPSVDIYSLGLVTIYALSGVSICKSKSATDAYNNRRTLKQRIRTLCKERDIPEPILVFLQKVCAFQIKDRLQTASNFAPEFKAALQASTKETKMASAPPLFLDEPKLPPQTKEPGHQTKVQPVPKATYIGIHSRKTRPSSSPPPIPKLSKTRNIYPFPRGQQLEDRNCQFLAFQNESIVLQLESTRIQIMSTPNPDSDKGRTITIKGVNCFVSKPKQRPSLAIQTEKDCEIDLISPQQCSLGRIYVSFGKALDKVGQFMIGTTSFSLAIDREHLPILIDSPKHKQSFFLYDPRALHASRPK